MNIARHYTFHLVCTVMLLTFSTAGATFCILAALGSVPFVDLSKQLLYLLTVVCGIVLFATIARLVRLVCFPIRNVTTFTQALANRDATLRYIATRDPMVGEMMESMNGVLTSYCHDRMDTEMSRKYNDDILRVMTHELRNTVTPIVSLTSWLQTEPHSEQDTNEAIDVIHKEAEEIRSFLDSYQKLTHLPSPELKPMTIGELFRSISTLWQKEVSAQRITFNAGDDVRMEADAGLLSLALNNLIRNALQVTDGMEQGRVSVSAFNEVSRARIVVSNNGPQLAPQELERIFQPFYTTDKQHGSGIGLPLSRRIAEVHGGTLTCESTAGLTFFELIIPKV